MPNSFTEVADRNRELYVNQSLDLFQADWERHCMTEVDQ